VWLRRAVLILLALVLVPSMATATSYRCMYDGVTRSACCCPAEPRHEEAPAGELVLRAACCCTVAQATLAARSVGTTPDAQLHPAIAPIAVTVAPAFAATLASVTVIARPHAPRGPPSSLLAHRCSLLL
jgi:hypothetical protein